MTKTPLKNVADIQTGPFGSQLHKEDYVSNGTPIVTVEHLGQRIFTEQNLPRVSDPDKKRLSKYVLDEGDIVFSRVGSVDRCSFVDQEHTGWLFSGRCLRVRPTKSIHPLFLYYFFCLESTKQVIRNIAVGATMPSINTKLLGEVELQYPNLDEQRKIVSILSSIDSKIELNNRINRNLHDVAKSIFHKYYLTSTQKKPFTDIVQVLGGGTPKTGESSFWNGFIPFFTPKDVNFPYTITTEKYITEEGLKHCNSRLYPLNTVFVTARGTVGKIGLAGVPMAMNQSCYALLGKNIDSLLTYFYTHETVSSLKHKASGAVFDAITTKDFENELINVLDQKTSEEVLKQIRPMFEYMVGKCYENLRLAALRDALLPRLMSGELDVSSLEI